MAQRTIPWLFEESVKKFTNNPMMRQKTGEKYVSTSYTEIQKEVYEFAAGLISLGIKKGDRIALISEGRNAWVISELAILYTGAINVPLSVKLDELSDLKFRLSHSDCRMVIASKNQAEKIRKIKNDLPEMKLLILLDFVEAALEDEMAFDEVKKQGKKYLELNQKAFEQCWKSIKESDYANICYTSGTTADPKGIILTHRNYTANVEQSAAHFDIPEVYVSLLLLPWDHAFAHTAGVYTLISSGASMASVEQGATPLETLKNVALNIKETRPHFLLSVPALAKNFKKNIEKGIRDKGSLVQNLFNKALELSCRYNADGWNKGKGFSIFSKLKLMLYDKIIYSKIRENFGGRLEFFVGGGALLDIELQRFFYAIGIPMYQGYGLTEAAPVISSNSPKSHKLGSSGKIVPGIEIKICDEKGKALPAGEKGEIVVKGENNMAGYWKNEKATNEAIKNSWLHTGDMGYLDQDNFLYVLGRFKSLLISSDGEKYSPEGIEEAIVEHSPYIDQIMLYNNQNPYTVALVVVNKEAVLSYLKSNKLSCRTEEGRCTALNLIQNEINAFKENGKFSGMFPSRWLPSAIAVIGEAFTEQNQFLNSTMKMVRGKIAEFYKNRIEYLYTPEAKDICNDQNKTIIHRFEG